MVLIGAEFVPTVGTLLATIPRMHPIFSVKIDVMVTEGQLSSGWTNIVHITQGAATRCLAIGCLSSPYFQTKTDFTLVRM